MGVAIVPPVFESELERGRRREHDRCADAAPNRGLAEERALRPRLSGADSWGSDQGLPGDGGGLRGSARSQRALSLSQLTGRTRLSCPTVIDSLTRLEGLGLVVSTTREAGRAKTYYVSDPPASRPATT